MYQELRKEQRLEEHLPEELDRQIERLGSGTGIYGRIKNFF